MVIVDTFIDRFWIHSIGKYNNTGPGPLSTGEQFVDDFDPTYNPFQAWLNHYVHYAPWGSIEGFESCLKELPLVQEITLLMTCY